MFKEVFGTPLTTWLSVAGLIIFFAAFVSIVIWVMTRSKSEVNHWSQLPMAPDDGQAHPREQEHHEPTV